MNVCSEGGGGSSLESRVDGGMNSAPRNFSTIAPQSSSTNTTTSAMAQSNNKAADGLKSLKSTVATTSSLISHLQASAVPSSTSKHPELNALDLAHDTVALIRAHSTKLSLLIINNPFTPSAIVGILRELVAGPLPGLASAVELCDAGRYTKAVSAELQYLAGRVFTELSVLIKTIPLDGRILSNDAKNGMGAEKGRGSLAVTGTVWEACDAILELKALGIAGLIIKKAEQYRDTLKDALEELQEWGEETSSDEEDAVSGDKDNAQAEEDDIFGKEQHISSGDPEKIRPRLDSSIKRLRLVVLMYQAVVKRRFKTLPYLPHPELPPELKAKPNEDPGIISCLDTVLELMKKIPDTTDELASAFYELDGAGIDKRMEECFLTGFSAVQPLVNNWEGQKDEFSTWVSIFPYFI